MILDNDIQIQDNVLLITPELLESYNNFKKHNVGTWKFWTYVSKTGTKIVFSLSYGYNKDVGGTGWYARINLPTYKTLEVTTLNKLIDACECAAEMYNQYKLKY